MYALQKLLREMQKEGFVYACRHGLRVFADCRYCFVYEPAEVMKPMSPSTSFEASDGHARVAVQIHLFYPQLTEELIDYVNRIPYRFDCFISTDTPEKAALIESMALERIHAVKTEVACFLNQGRDMAPFICQITPHIGQYDYVCHLHGKCSTHNDFGNQWRRYLFIHLLKSPGHIAAMLDRMETDHTVGLIFSKTYPGIKRYLGWRGNRQRAEELMKRMGLQTRLPNRPCFPAGNMFWARMDAIAPAFMCGLASKDFEQEQGQLEGTLAHCMERCWGCIAQAKEYRSLRVKLPGTGNTRGAHDI